MESNITDKDVSKFFELLEKKSSSKDEQDQIQPKHTYRAIELSECETKVLTYLLIGELLATILSFGISIISIFRKESDLQMSRSSYWLHFFFCLIIFVSLYQAINAINKKKDKNDAITCFFILNFIILVIDLIIFTRLLIVEFPLNEDSVHKLKNWEVIILYVTTICRLVSLFVTFCILVIHVDSYYQGWDVDPNYRPEV